MGKHETVETRAKIVALKEAKLSFPAIFWQLQLKNPSTVRNNYNNFQRTGSLNSKKQSEAYERFLI